MLVAESLEPVEYEDDRQCRVESGRWWAPYLGHHLGNPSHIDVDHHAPLKNAHLSGGWAWDAERKEQYASHLGDDAHLIAISSRHNRSKGARGPEEWAPPDNSLWCQYATDWAEIKEKWGLTMTPVESEIVMDMLGTCETSVRYEVENRDVMEVRVGEHKPYGGAGGNGVRVMRRSRSHRGGTGAEEQREWTGIPGGDGAECPGRGRRRYSMRTIGYPLPAQERIIGAPMSLTIHIHSEELVPAIQSLEDYFRDGGASIVQAAFQHTYFIHPKAVLMRTPFSPGRARRSREHYPGIDKGQKTFWKAGDGREIILDDNSRAQLAWQGYTGHKLARGSGYGVRHIWGNTHNPEAFTAGWNLCYMPFWAGMLTENQHPHPELRQAIRQASWDLFFSGIPVCEPPEFVSNPGVDLGDILDGNPLLIMSREPERAASRTSTHRDIEGPTLPVVLEPENAEDFKRALLRTKEAWIEVSYQDGRKEVKHWNATRIQSTSNILGNLRSRPEFRNGAWQENGIASVRVTIEHPGNTRG